MQKLQAIQQLPAGKKSRKAANGAAADAADDSAKRKPEHVGGGKPAKIAKRDKAIKDEKTKLFRRRRTRTTTA